jgi:arylsulfate sulfotransferase
MRKLLMSIGLASLAACGGQNGASNSGTAPEVPDVAKARNVIWESSEPGITPFISVVHLVGQEIPRIQSISYVVEPKPDSVSKPVRVTYTRDALESRGRLTNDRLLLPVLGLYAEFENEVSIELNFDDFSTQTIAGTLTTAAYTDPNYAYDEPLFITKPAADGEQSFDFVAMKSRLGTPVIFDTDGAIRWVGVSSASSIFSVFKGCETSRDAVPVPFEDMRFL